ncbi:MAG: chitobiase/beta-hexosaminidase C-terminal domain-containing protein [Patescibacteria group bacterium]|jgi:hypothetical protein
MKKQFMKSIVLMLFVLGSFCLLGSQALAKDSSTWGKVGVSGMDDQVSALAVYNNELYAGGFFSSADGIVSNQIAKWNGTSWSKVGTEGMNATISSLAVYNNELYAGGDFTTADGNPAIKIAKWNGSTWSSVGTSGMSGRPVSIVSSLTVYNNELYAGGIFNTVDGIAVDGIAKWNGVRWSKVSSGEVSSIWVEALAVYNNELYAGGLFTGAFGTTGIAKWNGTTWSKVGATGTSDDVYALAVYDNELYAGGSFLTADLINANYIAKWNGTEWSKVGTSGMDEAVYALTVYNNELYAGGFFGSADSVVTNHIARWNKTAWNKVGVSGLNSIVYALAVYNDELYAGGSFTTADGIITNNIASWYIDYIAPVTKASPTSGTYNTAKLITLTTDEPATTYYTKDGSTPTTSSAVYTTQINLSANTILKFFSKDVVGNIETVKTEIYIIDTIAPTTTASPVAGTYKTAQAITLKAVDTNTGVSATYYTTDGSTPTTSSSVYSSPITISQNATLKFFSKDNVGNTETVKTAVYVIDTVAPTTTASPVGGNYATDQTVTLTATDDNSGVSATYYTLDGKTPTTSSLVYSSPISLTSNTSLKFFSKDKAGNVEAVKTVVYAIDKLAPTTTASPIGGTYTSNQAVTLTAIDTNTGVSATYYTIDGSTPTASSSVYSSKITISQNTTLKFFSKDAVGNTENVKTEIYVIDKTAPITTASLESGTYTEAKTVTLTATDDNTGVLATYYTTDDSTPTTSSTVYSGPIAISENTTLKFFSKDKAGNLETVKTKVYVIDSLAPTTTATPASGTYNSIQNVTLKAVDTNSGIAKTYYTTDSTTPTTSSSVYSSPIAISKTTALRFFSKDTAGNTESVKTEIYVIDTQSPVTTATPASGTYSSTQTVTLKAVDTNTGVSATYYTTDGTIPTTQSLSYSAPIVISQNTSLKFFSIDAAGNKEVVKTENYIITNTFVDNSGKSEFNSGTTVIPFDEKIYLRNVILGRTYYSPTSNLELFFYRLPRQKVIHDLYIKMVRNKTAYDSNFNKKKSYPGYTILTSNIGTVKKDLYKNIDKHIKFKVAIRYSQKKLNKLNLNEKNLRLFIKNRDGAWQGPFTVYQNTKTNVLKFKIRNYRLKSEIAHAFPANTASISSLSNRSFSPAFYVQTLEFQTLEKLKFIIAEKNAMLVK